MLRIRLRRVGKKGHPSYRIVVAESSAPRDGAYVEWIGNYDPMTNPPAVTLKADRAAEWLSKGAQPSDAVRRIFDWNGLLQRTPVERNRTRSSDAQAEEAAAPAAPAAVAVAEEIEDDGAAVEAPEEETDSEATAAQAPEEETEGEATAPEVTDELTDESTGDATPDDAVEESSDSDAGSEVTDQASEDGETEESST